MNKKPYHVIFLGAGASATSGYPVGQELRLQIASKEHFKKELQKIIPLNTSNLPAAKSYSDCLEHFDDFSKSVQLFRHGGFATVDEFSKLASEGYQEHVQNMKRLMRVVLSLHNPEEEFHKSDYYPFIQRLFREDKLNELRPDIAVMTFNYDCYLDFLLLEAYRYRQKLSENAQEPNDWWCNKLTSGFFNPNESGDWAQQTQGFNYFKLHGSTAYGNDPHFGHHTSFRRDKTERLGYLANDSLQQGIPPVVFPWELFEGDSGRFISEDEFVFFKEAKDTSAQQKARFLFRQLQSIWKNAKRIISRADKISFVGLSMHQYIEDGLAYLFDGKATGVQAVVANHSNEQFRNAKNRLHPSSLCGRVAAVFGEVAPTMKYVRSSSEDDGVFTNESPEASPAPDITPRYSFKEFIEWEMG